jgi:hypothetical protein
VTGIQYRFLHLSFLPTRCGVTELGLIQIVANHGVEALVDLALLATTHLIHCGLHVVVDATLRNTTEGSERI